MPSFTKKAIVESFMHLIGKKPLDKITVRDIVDDCGINRNTFYYYFQDIYAVLEELCDATVRHLPQGQTLAVTLSAFYRTLADFSEKYPHAAKSLSLSLGFEGMERYFATGLDGAITDCYVRASSTVPTDMQLRLLRHAILGLCLDVMRNPKQIHHTPEELEQILAPYPEKKTDKN